MAEEFLWRGRRLEDMSRDELIACAEDLIRRTRSYLTPEANRVRALGHVETLKRGER